MLTALLFWIIPLLDQGVFSEDILRVHNNAFEYFEDDEGFSFEAVSKGLAQGNFLPMDSMNGTKRFQHYWVKVQVPELEDSTSYYFNYYLPFDELTVHFANAPPFSKNWNRVSDTARFVDGRTYVILKKEDLIDGTHFYLRAYMANYKINSFFFQTLNGKALWFYIHQMSADRMVFYDIFNIAFLGAILIIFLYVLATYVYSRERVYLFYILYLFSIGVYLFSRSTMVHDYMYPLFEMRFPTWAYHLGYTFQFIIHWSYLLFAITFLDAKKNYPLFYQVGKYVSVFFLLCMGVMIVSIEFFPKSRFWIQLYSVERIFAVAFTILAQLYLFVKRKDQLVLFIVIGSVFFIVGGLISMLGTDVFYFRAGAIIEIVTFSLGLAYRLRRAEREKAQLEREVERVKMIALRTQMKPHFLFNTINSIRALILKGNKEEAYEDLAIFSKLIRYMLESSEQDLVPLKEELKMLDIYIDMEKKRLSSEFSYRCEVSPSIELDRTLLPPLILQPFLENAIIHGLLPKEGKKELLVTISSQDQLLTCLVEDNGVGRKAKKNEQVTQEKKSMAIDLTRKRIELLMPQTNEVGKDPINMVDLTDAKGEALGTSVKIDLPLIIRA